MEPMDTKPFNSYSHQPPPDYYDSNPRENDDALSISPISGPGPEDRTPLSAKSGKEPRGAYRPIRHADDAEAYLESITEAERDLLIGSRFSLDSNDSDDFGDRHFQKQPEKGRKGIRYFLPTWRYALLGVVVILVALFGLWGDVRFLSGPPPVHYDPVSWYPTPLGGTVREWEESYRKAQQMVQEMTLVEKVNITTGTGPADIVKFPSLCLQDGPLGLRFADNISAFPAGITTGATWNRDLFRERGRALGQESRLKGVNVILGPSMGAIGMNPAGGRNWEGFGSDPVLQGVAAAETIRGIQQNGVMATAKHYVMNEQEHFRQPFEWGIPTAISSNIDDRALHEVFVWPFAESIRADVASIMCSYQRVNNSHACENSKILNGILKDELGFQGFVQSDWLAQRSGVGSALSGLDMSMPGDGLRWTDGESLWGSQLTRAVLNSSVPMERLNDMVTRIVAAWYHLKQDTWEHPPPEGEGGPNFSSWTNEEIGHLHEGSDDDDATGVVNHFVDAQGKGPDAHWNVARKVAAEGTVLLKNIDNILPLSRDGSGPGAPFRVGIYGEDAGPGNGPNACPDRGCNQGTLASGWGSGAVEFPYLVSPWEALQTAWTSDNVDTKGYLTNTVEQEDLQDKDLCIVFANADGGEGFIHRDGIHGDRNDLFLQGGGDRLIRSVAAGCGNGQGKTVVVIHAIGPVFMEPWIDLPGVHAVLLANLPGEESGNALVDVLFGEVDASGRLPYTIGKTLADYGPNAQVLYKANGPVPQVTFTDGLYIDYRHFDRQNITPRFEFGFGLSYTTFQLSNLNIVPLLEKSALPSPRPNDTASPPSYDTERPDPALSLFPAGFRQLHKYIYPYLSSLDGTEPKKNPYPFPPGYHKTQHPSPAGGGPGGNPSLYEPVVRVQVQVDNTGSRTGKEVAQLYVSFPANVTEKWGKLPWQHDEIEFPVRVLRNFTKIELQSGESEVVEMTLSRKDLSYWSVRRQNWVMPEQGKFGIWVGRSSRDLALVGEY
ncbi:hypothetical protein MPDQ_001474 [Monascus purpureus]|uniref:Probable beta-glucosidase E n=1 Tax=Monascus purpureus TaxID=5098 RepID=A0A507R4K1_MONPU|nr:hypothetical protein MPDQ_001474 [Monascus purpureus]